MPPKTEKKKRAPTFTNLTDKVKILDIKTPIPQHCVDKVDDETVYEKKYPQDVRIATIGNVDAGKSTTLGVIKTQLPDDGRGLRRDDIFRHQHEKDSGRSSDVGNQYLQYQNRLYSLSDLAGHEPYLKTTIYGMISVPNDYAMLVVSANKGFEGMAQEHLGLATVLKMNLFIVITKIDLAPPEVFKANLEHLQTVIGKIRRKYIIIENIKDLEKYYNSVTDIQDDKTLNGITSNSKINKFVPIFLVSNTKMTNIDLLQTFMFNLRPTRDWVNEQSNDPVFIIDKPYNVTGVGIVVSGFVKHGTIAMGDEQTYMLGPFNGNYHPVIIKNIRGNDDVDIPTVGAGFSVCINIRVKDAKDKSFITKDNIEKGMVLTTKPYSVKTFESKITILHHPTMIHVGYEPHLHCGSTKKTMKILAMDKEGIQAGHSTNCTMEFKDTPQYVEVGDRFIFREGKTRGSGTITKIFIN